MTMHNLAAALAVALLLVATASPAGAQIAPPNEAGVAMGHLHYVVRDVEANTAFWVALGGEAERVGETVVVTFPDVLVLLDEGESSGGTEGSILNHMAFRVQSLDTVAAAGIELESLGSFSGIANVYAPEGERSERFDDTATNLTFTRDDGGADP
ncbi:MAG: VOC family protein, partial [Acidobacteria bacterium]|nr:VOC family protein [Acidobacteriota bacterium]